MTPPASSKRTWPQTRTAATSFPVSAFSGYGVSAVPEPGTLVLLLAGVFAAVLGQGWRKRLA